MLAITEVTIVQNILKDQVSELPQRSIIEKVDKIGLETDTFPTTAYAVVQIESEWSTFSTIANVVVQTFR